MNKLLYIVALLALAGMPFATAEEVCTDYSHVNDVPVTCDGGEITRDETAGQCRTVECEDGNGTVKRVLGCQKTWFYELYNQGPYDADADAIAISYGPATISNNGFAQSPNFPIAICEEEEPEDPPTDPTCEERVAELEEENEDLRGQVGAFEALVSALASLLAPFL